MNISSLSQTYSVRILSETDVQQVLRLYEGNPQYFAEMSSYPTMEGVYNDMTALPPGKMPKDKCFLGFFEGDVLVAVVDLIKGFPDEKTAFIGLLMVNCDYQKRGIGSEIVAGLMDALCSMGFQGVRLGYVESNTQSRAFWYKNGFSPTGIKRMQGNYVVVVMQKRFENG